MESNRPLNGPRPFRLSKRLAPFVSLQYRDFRLLWIGQLFSQAGTQMQVVAISWHIYLLTSSPLALGLIGLARAVPLILFSLFGGVLADAQDRRRLLLVTQGAMMLFATFLGLLTSSGWITVGLIYLMASLTSAALAFDTPARQALPPNLVPPHHLTNALSLTSMMYHLAIIIGPAVAGFIIAWKGVAAVYWINAASFLGMIGALVSIKSPTQERRKAAPVSLSALREGVLFVRRSPILLSTMLVDFFATFFSSAAVLLPIFAREILQVGPQGLGILYSAQSVGALCTGVGMSFAGNIKRKGSLVLWAIGVYGAATALYGVSRWFALSIFLLAVVGAADIFSAVLRMTIRQLATPDHLRGRMSSVNMIFFLGGPQLGNLEAGVVAAWLGAPLSVVTGGVCTLITVFMVALLVPTLRNYRDW